MDDYTKISHKSASSYLYENKENKKVKYLKNLVTRILISIILVIASAILIRLNTENIEFINKYVFSDSLKFTQINNWYQKNSGNLLPKLSENSNLVMENNDLKSLPYEKYLDGVKISVSKGMPISIINGGIVVFEGEKEGYGNSVIIQGNDGIDYTYGNLTNINVNLYDYIEKDTLIGESIDNFIYLVLKKDNEYLNYEE